MASYPEKSIDAQHDETISPDALASEAKVAAEAEHHMTLWEAIKTYPKAIGWSVLLSTTLIMEGYDLALLGNLYASPVFNEKFGSWNAEKEKYAVSPAWQSGLSNGARAGEIIGLIIAGWTSDRYGYKMTTIGSLVLMIAFVFVLFFAPNVKILVLGEVLCGIPWGAFQSVTPAYASEVAPVVLRPYLTTFINMCWVIGQFFAAAVNKGSVGRGDEWAYRIPFGVQWVWPVPILAGVIFAPESPWWYVRKGNRAAAKKSLLRLTSPQQPNFNADETIAMIEHTNEMEKNLKEGTTYRDCFKGVDLRRTEIVVGIWLVQTLGGQNLMGYFSYFLTQAGMDASNSFSLSMGQYALGMVGTMGSWFLMSRVGRRTIHFSGLCSQLLILIIVGSLSFSKDNSSVWAIGGMLILFTFVYDFTVGPVTYSLISELSSTRLKAKTIVMARAAYNASNIFVNVMTNYQLSSSAWNWGLAATPAPDDSLLLRRQFNTVCGYLGGDPGLPATCSAGSHCVVDVDHGAVGCCPDGGSCTSGVFTGCVDADSGPQTEVNPYVFTCRGSDSCYRNSYEGGFFQFGCGSTSGLATKVVATASGKSAIDLTSINVPLTQPVSSLSEPTTLGTRRRTTTTDTSATKSSTTRSASTKSTETSSGSTTESTASTTNSETSSTESETSTASETESDTSTETTASETSDPSSTESGDSDAPGTDGNDNGSKNTGAIIGGTISGVAALAALIVLGIWLWKRKKGNTRQGPGVKHQVQHIGPPLDNNHNFAPVPLMHEIDKMAPPPPVPVRNQQRTMNSAAGHDEPYSEPWDPSSNYGYGNSAGAVGGSSHMEHDEVPLTRDDDFDHSYNSGLGRISEEQPRPGTAISTPGQMSQVYPGPRGGGGGPLWQQNRGPGWF